jgi:decaprenylphospho-beta-D-erythro-pentofuranosid-2-ulose 2-reductase
LNWLLILGARSDIAKAVAHKYAQNGFNIYLAARNHQELERDVKDIEIRYQIKAQAVEFDVLDFNSHQDFYDSLQEKPLGVVCSVGYLGNQKKAELDFNEADKIIRTNYSGCVSMLSIIARDFEKRQTGFIIGISSVAGDRGRQSNYYYGSAKAGFSAYLSGLRNRLSKSTVPVLTVKPGFVDTKMTEGMGLPPLLTAQPEEVAEDIYRAWEKRKDVVYTKWFWRWIMLIIKNIPELLFKKMKL